MKLALKNFFRLQRATGTLHDNGPSASSAAALAGARRAVGMPGTLGETSDAAARTTAFTSSGSSSTSAGSARSSSSSSSSSADVCCFSVRPLVVSYSSSLRRRRARRRRPRKRRWKWPKTRQRRWRRTQPTGAGCQTSSPAMTRSAGAWRRRAGCCTSDAKRRRADR